MRVRVDIPELLPQLSDYLSRRGWVIVGLTADEANVSPAARRGEFEAAIMLLADIDLWRAQHPWTQVTVNPALTT